MNTVRDVMTHTVWTTETTATVREAAQLMAEHDIGFLPVVDDRSSRRLVGVITDRDITIRHVAGAHSDECAIKQHMTGDRLVTVAPDADTAEVHRLMIERQVRRIPVVDSEGRVLGVIAQADVATKEQRDQKTGEIVEKISEPAQL